MEITSELDWYCGNCDGDTHTDAREFSPCCKDPDPIVMIDGRDETPRMIALRMAGIDPYTYANL